MRWDEKKNRELKERHGLGFEDIIAGSPTGLIEVHPKHPDQQRIVMEVEGYAYVLVYERSRNRFANFWPSRKHTRSIK